MVKTGGNKKVRENNHLIEIFRTSDLTELVDTKVSCLMNFYYMFRKQNVTLKDDDKSAHRIRRKMEINLVSCWGCQ